MKRNSIVLLGLAVILSACSSTSSTSKSEKKAADFERTAALIESGNYQFTVRSASPSGGRTIQITSSYVMKAAEGSYEALLPYFGRVYSGGYGQGGSVEFRGEPENLQVERNDKRLKITVKFSISSEGEKYDVELNVGASGSGSLMVSSPRRQTISYNGLATELQD